MTPRQKEELRTTCKWTLVVVALGFVASILLTLNGGGDAPLLLFGLCFLIGTPAAFYLASQVAEDSTESDDDSDNAKR